jgi:hypothetical protein
MTKRFSSQADMVVPKRSRHVERVFLLAAAAPVIFAAAVAAILLIDANWVPLPCATLYAAIVLMEARYGAMTLQSLALGSYFAAGMAVWALLPEAGLLGNAVAGAFALLLVLSFVSMVLDWPLHGGHIKGWEPRPIRRIKAALWLIVCPPAIAMSLSSMPPELVMPGQLILAILGAMAASLVDLRYCGSLYRRSREFALERFTFREVGPDGGAVEQFMAGYADEIAKAVGNDRRARVRYGRLEIFEEACRKEVGVTARMLYFNAYDGDRVVGGVAVALDGPDRRLPLEGTLGLTLDPLRRYGSVMEVRRLSIDASYRFQPEIIRGLFKCVIEVALENDVCFMVDLAFHFVVNLLRKAGFEELHGCGCELAEFGSSLRLIALNLAAREYLAHQNVAAEQIPRYAVNQYLRYRYFSRAVVREACRHQSRRVWSLSHAAMEKLCFSDGNRPIQLAVNRRPAPAGPISPPR